MSVIHTAKKVLHWTNLNGLQSPNCSIKWTAICVQLLNGQCLERLTGDQKVVGSSYAWELRIRLSKNNSNNTITCNSVFHQLLSIMQSGKFIQYFKADGIELPAAALIDWDKPARTYHEYIYNIYKSTGGKWMSIQ